MAGDIQIREANRGDIPTIEYLIEAGYRTDEARMGWTHETDLLSGDRLSVGEIDKAFEDPNSKMFVAIDKPTNFVIGTICISKNDDWFEFGKFAVKPNLQGQGIGRQLIKYVEDFAREVWKAKSLKLSVISCRDELVQFYFRCGFKDTGRRIDFVKVHPYVILKEGVSDLEVIVMDKPL